jgi:hypothetical protein
MTAPLVPLALDDLRGAFGFGVAGNFAGHLEQAGEAADFAHVAAASAEAPKGIFPWWVPGDDTFLGVFPLSHDRLARPSGDDVNLQIEPEAGVLLTVEYATDGTIAALVPRALGAFDDCSIRRPGAAKISEKKNWGPDSKGVAATCFALDDLSPDGPTATFRLASFLRRDGATHAYGIDSPLPGYSYYGTQLLDWIVDRLAHQAGADGTPLEAVGAQLARAGEAGRIERVLVGIGATRYTPLGAETYLAVGDEAVVVVYDERDLAPADVEAAVRAGDRDRLAGASVLWQTVYDGG